MNGNHDIHRWNRFDECENPANTLTARAGCASGDCGARRAGFPLARQWGVCTGCTARFRGE